jgi:hypothetical protein
MSKAPLIRPNLGASENRAFINLNYFRSFYNELYVERNNAAA